MTTLEGLRTQIDGIDNEVIRLLDKRLQVSLQVKEYKKLHNMDVLDSLREQIILDKIDAYECDELIKQQIHKIYGAILGTSKEVQK